MIKGLETPFNQKVLPPLGTFDFGEYIDEESVKHMWINLQKLHRFGGASPVSVACHTQAVWELAGGFSAHPQLQILLLLHDLHEAIVGDSSRWLTSSLKESSREDMKRSIAWVREPLWVYFGVVNQDLGKWRHIARRYHEDVTKREMKLFFPEFAEASKDWEKLRWIRKEKDLLVCREAADFTLDPVLSFVKTDQMFWDLLIQCKTKLGVI